jgi:NADPH2:quinone reductase
VVAAGRSPEALEELKQLGADAVISLNLEREALVTQFREEWARDNIDVVLDYLWGTPAERVLETISQKGLQHPAARIRYVQIGTTAGPTISLPGAVLRSSGLEIMGSGFGSVSIKRIFERVIEFLSSAEKQPFRTKTTIAPLSDVEVLWSVSDENPRIVFRP